MKSQVKSSEIGTIDHPHPVKPSVKVWAGVGAIVAGLVLVAAKVHSSAPSSAHPQALASVAVSTPLRRDLDTQASFLGQYSAVEKVELRAQVGGTLSVRVAKPCSNEYRARVSMSFAFSAMP